MSDRFFNLAEPITVTATTRPCVGAVTINDITAALTSYTLDPLTGDVRFDIAPGGVSSQPDEEDEVVLINRPDGLGDSFAVADGSIDEGWVRIARHTLGHWEDVTDLHPDAQSRVHRRTAVTPTITHYSYAAPSDAHQRTHHAVIIDGVDVTERIRHFFISPNGSVAVLADPAEIVRADCFEVDVRSDPHSTDTRPLREALREIN